MAPCAHFRSRSWAASPPFTVLDYPIRELRGRVLGVIGWGTLGRAVAQRCEAALGMRVQIANRPGAQPQPDRVDLPQLLRAASRYALLHLASLLRRRHVHWPPRKGREQRGKLARIHLPQRVRRDPEL